MAMDSETFRALKKRTDISAFQNFPYTANTSVQALDKQRLGDARFVPAGRSVSKTCQPSDVFEERSVLLPRYGKLRVRISAP